MSARALPDPDADTRFFWEATAARRLDILRCGSCGTYVHYPKPVCWSCGGRDLTPTTVSGRGTVYSFTITHRPIPGFDPPFVVALIELEEQAGLRMISNLVDIEPVDVTIGMPVDVTFRPAAEDIWLPVFRRRT